MNSWMWIAIGISTRSVNVVACETSNPPLKIRKNSLISSWVISKVRKTFYPTLVTTPSKHCASLPASPPTSKRLLLVLHPTNSTNLVKIRRKPLSYPANRQTDRQRYKGHNDIGYIYEILLSSDALVLLYRLVTLLCPAPNRREH